MHDRVSRIKPRWMMYNLTSKDQLQNLTSGQGHDLTRKGHIVYHVMRLDETNTMKLFWSLYFHPVQRCYTKSACGLRLPG